METTGILDVKKRDCSGYKTIICVNPELENTLVEKLLELDCKVYVPTSEEDATEKIRYHTFDLVICEEGFGTEAIQVLQSFPMGIRRNMFFVFIGEEVETFNFMQSLVLSANLLISIEDLGEFENILEEALNENKRFFRPFTIALENMY